MVPNKQTPNRRPGSGQKPKYFDITPAKKRSTKSSFPEIGMTLSSYSTVNSAKPRKTFNKPVKSKTSWRSKITKKRVILLFAALVLLAVGWLGWKFAYNAQKLFGGNVFSVLTSQKLDGEAKGRVNILLAGNSADDPGHPGATLTDSIMIMSIDTNNNTGFMMSVPRDLYVKYGRSSVGKINSVFPAGESTNFKQDGYADGGMGLLQKTIYQTFGIETQYYALVNYNALREAVDSVGGVEVTVNSTNPKGLYDPSKDYTTGGVLVKLPNGINKLNGQKALNLARARGDARGAYGYQNSDFTRTENQRKIILALRSKATSAGVVTNPIKLGNLFDSIGNNVNTDMELGNVRRLYEITKDIPGGSIQSVGLNDANGVNLLANFRTSRGESALVPAAGTYDYSDIQKYIQRLMSSNLVVRENAKVAVLNGTATSGLAGKESIRLENKSFAVDTVDDADKDDYVTTQIIDLSEGKKPASLKALKALYPGSIVGTVNPLSSGYDNADFIIIVGKEREPQSSNAN